VDHYNFKVWLLREEQIALAKIEELTIDAHLRLLEKEVDLIKRYKTPKTDSLLSAANRSSMEFLDDISSHIPIIVPHEIIKTVSLQRVFCVSDAKFRSSAITGYSKYIDSRYLDQRIHPDTYLPEIIVLDINQELPEPECDCNPYTQQERDALEKILASHKEITDRLDKVLTRNL